ncbi:unnamed protein product [marine sediment metagenome]|uniref:Ribbon-helix-helix protein CopG domain-containing protein n=1 Tax=marine sediment metagenome TaxID=412755 RepID=X0Z7E7_9ZZZZ
MMDEKLFDELDADEEIRRLGRSAVFRRMAAEYIEHHRRRTILSMYRQTYGKDSEGLGKEFNGWENEGRWPSE